MTTARSTLDGPAHVVASGRAICTGAHATLPPGDAPGCRQCARSLEKRARVREERG
jgi:hypothetical protein